MNCLFQEKITKNIISKSINDFSYAQIRYGDGGNEESFSRYVSKAAEHVYDMLSTCSDEFYKSEKLEKSGKLTFDGKQLYRGALNYAIDALRYALEVCSYCNIKYKKLYHQHVESDLNEKYIMHEEMVKRNIVYLKDYIRKAEMNDIDKNNILQEIDSLEKIIFWNLEKL